MEEIGIDPLLGRQEVKMVRGGIKEDEEVVVVGSVEEEEMGELVGGVETSGGEG